MKTLLKILLLIPLPFLGQDVHFIQSSVVPQLLNPATVGVFEGWERVSLAHRQQWLSMGSPYITSQLSADLNLMKGDNGAGKWGYLGLGLNFYNDVAGDGKFGTNQFSLSVAGIIPLNEVHTLSAGIQLGGAQRTGNINSLNWGNQWNGKDGFSQDLASNETSNASFIYPDLGIGVYYNYADFKSTMVRKEFQNIYGGVSYFHLTKPYLTYRNGTSDRLYSKLVFLGGAVLEIPKSTLAIAPSATYIVQGPFNETLLSLLLKFRLKNGSKYTGIIRDSYFSFGGAVRLNDSFAPKVFFEIGSFKIGLAYELTTSTFANAGNNSFEITLQWANMKTALFKGRRTKGWIKPGGGL